MIAQNILWQRRGKGREIVNRSERFELELEDVFVLLKTEETTLFFGVKMPAGTEKSPKLRKGIDSNV